MTGKLYIISTPIGNLEDITLRALRIMREVDIIACEDTRVTKKLLNYYEIQKPLTSYHEHNEIIKTEELVGLLESGENIALVTDAGTPGVSDPGYRLVKRTAEKGIAVIPVPGPSAAIAALSASGLPTSSFVFFGFLPKADKKRRLFLEEIQKYPQTLVFYESPHRILRTLKSILETLGDRQASVSRELTKMFEETLRDKISKVIATLGQKKELKGEFTIVVEGNDGRMANATTETLENRLKISREKGSTLKDSVKEVSESCKIPKSQVYREALKIWGKS